MVQVAHRQCRQDDRRSERQWRLSFSRAEIVLLNSWVPEQQIVYHMLRFFVKIGRLTDITDGTGTKLISNYHLKTLMLRVCELKPRIWWTDDTNVVGACVQLLHILAKLLKRKIIPHYFVKNCNLVYDTEHLEIMSSQLAWITESWLSAWFVKNYLHECAQLCPDTVSRLFDDISTRTNLHNAVSAVGEWRQDSALSDRWFICNLAEYYMTRDVSVHSLTPLSCSYWINELVKIDSCLHDYFTAVVCLHIANKIAKRSSSDELMHVLATLLGQFVGKRRYCHQLSSELSLSQTVILMKVVANNSRSTVQQIEFELSKAYLYRALRCKDSDSDSIYCLANVYLAVLYYTSGQYQTVIDHCTLVTISQDHSQCSSHVVQGDLLPKVDDDIDNVLGLAVFYRYVRTAALNQQQTRYVVVFTSEFLAHYLYIRCLSVSKGHQFKQMPSTDEVQRHAKFILDIDQLFIVDVLLLRLISMSSEPNILCKSPPEQCQELTINASEPDMSQLVELLQQSAVEHFTTYRQLQVQRFGSVATIVTTDLEALYEYKHGDYRRCLQLLSSQTYIRPHAQMSSISTYPEFIQLMDDDIASLTALIMFISPECRNGCSHYYELFISQPTLSLYLMTQCRLKLHHSVESLYRTLEFIQVAKRSFPVDRTLDHLILTLAERKLVIYLSSIMRC